MVSGPENNGESTFERALNLLQDNELVVLFFSEKKNKTESDGPILRTRRGNPFRRLRKSYEVNVDVLKLTKDGFLSKLDFS